MQYQIVQQVEGRKFVPVRDDKTNEPLILATAADAKAHAEKLTLQFGGKFQPRPIKSFILKHDWRDRERKRFEKGEYKPLIWVKEPWWREINDHFAHVGIKDKTMVAFTPDETKGAADKQTAMTPGKYLQKFFGDKLDCEQIRKHAMEHNLQFEKTELKFAKTVEEIEAVYKPTIGCSCFSGTTKANLYGSGDFAVAYLEIKGKITARSVCVPERKIYVHPYGDRHRMECAFEKLGFKEVYGNDHFKGLRFLKKWHWIGFYADWGTPNLKPDPKDDTYLIIS